MEISDTALLRKWQRSSDSETFAVIVTRHSAMVLATCNRILRNAAEDVAQECFMEPGGVRRLIGDFLGGLPTPSQPIARWTTSRASPPGGSGKSATPWGAP